MMSGKYTNNCRVVKNQHGNIISKDMYQPPDIEIDNKNVKKT